MSIRMVWSMRSVLSEMDIRLPRRTTLAECHYILEENDKRQWFAASLYERSLQTLYGLKGEAKVVEGLKQGQIGM